MDSPLSRSPGRKELSEDWGPPGPPWSWSIWLEPPTPPAWLVWGAAQSPPPAPGKDHRWLALDDETAAADDTGGGAVVFHGSVGCLLGRPGAYCRGGRCGGWW